MWAVIFVGSLYVFIIPGFSLYYITDELYTWLDSLDACNMINMTLASQQSVHNTTSLSPSKTEAYWIQGLEITRMFPRDDKLSPYNESFIVEINGGNLQHQCTQVGVTIACEAKNDSDNLINLANFNRFRSMLGRHFTYRIGHGNYTALLNENGPARLIRCLLYSEGIIFSDECSRKRRAICVKGEIQKYAVSRLDGYIQRYVQEPPSTAGAATTIIDTTSYHPDNNSTSFTPSSPNHGIIIDNYSKNGNFNQGYKQIIIIACTICGTLALITLIIIIARIKRSRLRQRQSYPEANNTYMVLAVTRPENIYDGLARPVYENMQTMSSTEKRTRC